ncbi:MAG: DNA-protecting protein DprA [Clostridia bacterium]|nr:DNA-protecting protein DprA [Clostridia bacterium]
MDRYIFNLKCLRDWCELDYKSQKKIIDYFKNMEHIRWETVSVESKTFNIEGKINLPFGASNYSYLDQYNAFMSKLKDYDTDYITPKSIYYSDALRNMDHSPEILYSKGNRSLVSSGQRVAIVGSRRPTSYGRKVASELSKFLAAHGVTVVSGLALGIDAIAHKAALDMSSNTIAVMASGVNRAYPRTNASIYHEIIQNDGLILSEKAFDEAPKPYEFPLRNRLISAISDIVVIIEAAEASGTLTTAMHGLNQGKTIFALPGSIYSELSRGTNKLIYDGALPLINFEDILLELGIETIDKSMIKKDFSNLSPVAMEVMNLISKGKKMEINRICEEMMLEYSEIISAINELILEELCDFASLTEVEVK